MSTGVPLGMRVQAFATWCLLATAAAPLSAQSPGIPGPTLNRLSNTVAVQDTATRLAARYGWQEPTLIAGGVFGALGNLLVAGFCTSSESRSNDHCALPGEAGFIMIGGTFGLVAGLIAASPHPPQTPKGSVISGDRRTFGALLFGVPSLAVNAILYQWYCSRDTQFVRVTPSSCNVDNFVTGLAVSAFNAWLGSLLGKAIPTYREM